MVEKSNTLFSDTESAKIASVEPLSVRMRPTSLDDFVGQEQFLGKDKLLRRMLEAGKLSSLIFHGPPGTGKTSLARVIANYTKANYYYLSAPAASVKDIRDVIVKAKDDLCTKGTRTVLFIDEIHRFNRAQQDVLLDDVESGLLILIGATTENPFFSVNSPLLSRSSVFGFEPIGADDIYTLLQKAVSDKDKGLGKYNLKADEDALRFLCLMCNGDARKALNALEVGVLSQASRSAKSAINFNLAAAKESIQQRTINYNNKGDSHYDLASALQKSMRGSDPDATVYWLARLMAGGEDPRFIARRICVCAAEDVGNADPMATVLAASAMQISELVGFPEAQLPLAQAAIYIACAPKSNASSMAIWAAVSDVKNTSAVEVPKDLKDSHYVAAKKAGIGAGYKYPHSYEDGFVVQDYLPKEAKKEYYSPKNAGYEKNIGRHLQRLRSLIQNSVTMDLDGKVDG